MKKKWSYMRILAFLICLGAFLTTAIILLRWWIEGNKAIETNEKLIKEVTFSSNIQVQGEEGSLFQVDFAKLKEMNDEVVGWVRIPKTNISYPIVQAQDNEFYLKHDIYKQYSSSGTIFLDYKNHTDFTDNNTVIYGHNMKNGSMFAELKKLDSLGCDTIQIYLEDEVKTYKIFSIYTIEAEDYSIRTDITNEQSEEFINTIKKRSRTKYDIEIVGTEILTLSTCYTDNKRTLVHAMLES